MIASAARVGWIACAFAIFCGRTAQASPAQDYMLHCMGCHGAEARGVAGKVPPLANALGRFMRTPEGRNYILRVPGAANSALSDARLAAVLNWVAQTFNANEIPKGASPFTATEVARLRHSPLTSVVATRHAVVTSLAATGAAPAAQY